MKLRLPSIGSTDPEVAATARSPLSPRRPLRPRSRGRETRPQSSRRSRFRPRHRPPKRCRHAPSKTWAAGADRASHRRSRSRRGAPRVPATASTGSLAAFIAPSLAVVGSVAWASGNDKRDVARACALTRVTRDEAAVDPVLPTPHPVAFGPPRRPEAIAWRPPVVSERARSAADDIGIKRKPRANRQQVDGERRTFAHCVDARLWQRRVRRRRAITDGEHEAVRNRLQMRVDTDEALRVARETESASHGGAAAPVSDDNAVSGDVCTVGKHGAFRNDRHGGTAQMEVGTRRNAMPPAVVGRASGWPGTKCERSVTSARRGARDLSVCARSIVHRQQQLHAASAAADDRNRAHAPRRRHRPASHPTHRATP